jgi:hypothetical protein
MAQALLQHAAKAVLLICCSTSRYTASLTAWEKRWFTALDVA